MIRGSGEIGSRAGLGIRWVPVIRENTRAGSFPVYRINIRYSIARDPNTNQSINFYA